MSFASDISRLPSLARKAALGALHVLVVEDNAADAHLITQALGDMPKVGLVEVAQDGIEALQYLDAQFVPPDIAIVDLQMPRLDGFRLLIEFGCRDSATFPIIVLTSSSAPKDIVRSLFRGASQVISKPESLAELKNRLTAAIATLTVLSDDDITLPEDDTAAGAERSVKTRTQRPC